MSLVLVARENMDIAQQKIAQGMEAIIESSGTELDVDAVWRRLRSGENQLWLEVEGQQIVAWLVTSISSYDSVRRLRLILLAGVDLEEWIENMDVVEEWAMNLGCREVEGWVRPGLRKRLAAYGYRKAYEVVVKDLRERIN